MKRTTPDRKAARLALGACCATLALGGGPASAVDISRGDWTGSWDTTLSWGAAWRTEDRDPSIIGRTNGGTAFSVNGDDGNLNYDEGLISNAVKVTTELLLQRDSFGGFIRATGFYDFENKDGDRDRTPLSERAEDVVGSDAELLDAYIWKQFDLGERPAEVRFGNQVLSWGESTFIQNSINTINPVDVSKLRVPGAELREALKPIAMLSGSFGVTDDSSLEAFIQLDWEETEIDPPGTYFSTNDFVGPGGNRVQLGFASDSAPEGDFLAVGRAANRQAEDSGQFGLAYRWFVPDLNDTEFGVYYIRYHSRLPIISGNTGSAAGLTAAGAAATAIYTAAQVAPGTNPTIDAAAGAAATDAYADTASYFIDYPEDIQLLGLSFNTTVGDFALQGEVSHRRDVPLQVDDVELLFAALSPIDAVLGTNFTDNQLSQSLNGGNPYALSSEIPGFVERDVTQVQATLTRLLPQVLGASQLALVGEVGVTFVHDFPDKDELRLEAPGTYISGNEALADRHGPAAGQFEAAEHFADETSWGYRLLARLLYTNAIGAINLAPRIAWAEDVQGNTPGPGGNFLEGRTALTLGLEATYIGNWEADLSYTRFDGADRYNLVNDRDFLAFDIKYSF